MTDIVDAAARGRVATCAPSRLLEEPAKRPVGMPEAAAAALPSSLLLLIPPAPAAGSAQSSPLVRAFSTPPIEDNGLNSTMARMFTSGNAFNGSPVWSPNGSPSLEDARSIRVISSGESVAFKIEQERRRARGSIYAQRSRDNSKAQAIRLRLQNEVQQLQASNAQLDESLAQYAGALASASPLTVPVTSGASSDAGSQTA